MNMHLPRRPLAAERLQPWVCRVVKKFEPVVIAFQDLWYSVPDPHSPKESLTLLKGISGYAMPGSITTLMGSTGAGKTTLMDVIAGRKTGGTIQGKILLNGYEANDLAIRRCTGYCEQMDIHSDASTIREALIFSAFLRQDSSVPDSQKYDSVEECLELLDLQSVADEIVRGSPTERMKRLTIGVELAADPKVLFLDEPTSGLDARSAKLIMDGVRKVADTGRTIVCTIHQPSTEVFMLFDKLLLKRGGQTVFFGDLGKRAQKMVDYFEAIPGVTPLREGYNPATWMLECIGARVIHVHDNPVDFVDVFNSSKMKHEMDMQLSSEGKSVPVPGSSEVTFGKKTSSKFFDADKSSGETLHGFVLANTVHESHETGDYASSCLGVWSCLRRHGLHVVSRDQSMLAWGWFSSLRTSLAWYPLTAPCQLRLKIDQHSIGNVRRKRTAPFGILLAPLWSKSLTSSGRCCFTRSFSIGWWASVASALQFSTGLTRR